MVIPVEVCSELWQMLKRPEFTKIVDRVAGEGAWKDLLRMLLVKRQQ